MKGEVQKSYFFYREEAILAIMDPSAIWSFVKSEEKNNSFLPACAVPTLLPLRHQDGAFAKGN